jgi:hypothetical protein
VRNTSISTLSRTLSFKEFANAMLLVALKKYARSVLWACGVDATVTRYPPHLLAHPCYMTSLLG